MYIYNPINALKRVKDLNRLIKCVISYTALVLDMYYASIVHFGIFVCLFCFDLIANFLMANVQTIPTCAERLIHMYYISVN